VKHRSTWTTGGPLRITGLNVLRCC